MRRIISIYAKIDKLQTIARQYIANIQHAREATVEAPNSASVLSCHKWQAPPCSPITAAAGASMGTLMDGRKIFTSLTTAASWGVSRSVDMPGKRESPHVPLSVIPHDHAHIPDCRTWSGLLDSSPHKNISTCAVDFPHAASQVGQHCPQCGSPLVVDAGLEPRWGQRWPTMKNLPHRSEHFNTEITEESDR
jgi:hypothetical protein